MSNGSHAPPPGLDRDQQLHDRSKPGPRLNSDTWKIDFRAGLGPRRPQSRRPRIVRSTSRNAGMLRKGEWLGALGFTACPRMPMSVKPKRAKSAAPVTAKVLSRRLSELEARGVIARSVLPTSPPSVEYELTALGAELIPALDAIVSVGHRMKEVRRSKHAPARTRRRE